MRFKNCEGQIARWLEVLSAHTLTIVHRAGRVHNNADSLSRRPCYSNDCKHCDRYERRYFPKVSPEIDRTEKETNIFEKTDGGWGDSLLQSVTPVEMINTVEKIDGGRGDSLLRSVAPPESIITEHINNAPLFETQEDSPGVEGPVICDDIYVSDRLACSITPSLGPGVAEVLSLEMTHGNYQTGVPHFTHASNNSVCEVTEDYIEDWIDLCEDGPLFGCLFENGKIPEELQVARAGMATISEGVHSDKPRCHCERRSEMIDTNTLIKGIVQDGQECGYGICKNKLCLNVSQHLSESDESSASTSKSEECLDITLENIRDQQEKDAILKLLLQWKRSKEKPHWSAVAPYCKELKAYWHEWDTIELKDNVLYKIRERDVGNDAEYLFLVPVILRKETFKQLHEYITAGHLGRRKTYDKIRKRFYWCNMYKDVSYWCRVCSTCGSRKMPYRHAKAPMRQYNVGYPMERIGLDISGPYPASKRGHKYLMVASCYFTKWMDAIPLKTQEATHVASELVDRFISVFGVPLQLHTDLGSNFESKVFQEVCKLLGIEKTRTSV